MGYGHLSIDERESIMKMLGQGGSYGDIGERLGRHKGTISREVRRNVSSTGEYKPHLAQRYYGRRRAGSKEPYRLEEDAGLREYVQEKLKKYWSPEQISGRIRQERGIDVSPIVGYIATARQVGIYISICVRVIGGGGSGPAGRIDAGRYRVGG